MTPVALRMRALRADGSIRWDAIRIYALQFLTLGIALVSSIVVARVLGPAGKGIVDLFLLLSSFVLEFGLLGLNSGLLFYLVNRQAPFSEVHSTGLAFSLIAGSGLGLVGWVSFPLWAALIPGLPRWAIVLTFVLSPVAFYRLIWQNLMVGLERAVQSYRIGLVVSVCTLVGTVILWFFNALSAGTIIVLTAGAMVGYALLAYFSVAGRLERFAPSRSLTSKSLRFGLVIYLGFLANVLHFKVDQVMINRMLGTDAVGIYTVSVRWAEMLFILDGALIASALHRISSLPVQDSYALTRKLFGAQWRISAVAGGLLALSAYPLVVSLYGIDYKDAALPLILLVPGVVAWSSAKVLSQFILYRRGNRWLPTAFAAAGLCVNVVLNVVFIPRFGIAGAGLASLLSYCLVLLSTSIAFAKLRA